MRDKVPLKPEMGLRPGGKHCHGHPGSAGSRERGAHRRPGHSCTPQAAEPCQSPGSLCSRQNTESRKNPVYSTSSRDREKCQSVSTALGTISLTNHSSGPTERAVRSHSCTAEGLLLPAPHRGDLPKEKQSSQVSLDEILIPGVSQDG